MQGLQAYYGIEDEALWKLVTGLGSGMGRRGLVCGAVTGGILAIGLRVSRERGSTREDTRGLREETYSKVQELTRRFEERFGAVDCSELTCCDFLTEQGQKDFKARGLMDSLCRPAVRFVVETAAGL